MIRMRSPVYFENVFGDFSIIPIWFLRDRIQQSIDLPVVCSESSRNQKLAKGRIVRCNSNGALLQSRFRQGLESAQTPVTFTYNDQSLHSFEFDEQVDRVLLYFVDIDHSGYQFRWDNQRGFYLKVIFSEGFIWCEFSGKTIYYRGLMGFWDWSVTIYPFKFI